MSCVHGTLRRNDMARVRAKPGDLIGYNPSPMNYYWLIFGEPRALMTVRFDWDGEQFQINGVAYPCGASDYSSHHLVWRRGDAS